MQQESNYKFTVVNNLDTDIYYLFISMCIQLDLEKKCILKGKNYRPLPVEWPIIMVKDTLHTCLGK